MTPKQHRLERNRAGRLTQWAFAMGLREEEQIGGTYVVLEADGPGYGYRVRTYAVSGMRGGRDTWQNTPNMKDAYKLYNKMRRAAARWLAELVLE